MAPTPSDVSPQRKGPISSKFKPPRPITSAKEAPKPTKTSTKNLRKLSKRSLPADGRQRGRPSGRRPTDPSDLSGTSSANLSDDDDTMNSDSESRSHGRASQASGLSDASSTNNGSQPPPSLPPALLTKLFHHHFSDDKVRMSAEARAVAGKYVEVFVREAIARAAFERQEGLQVKTQGPGTTVVGEGDFIEVEDLEKLAPQLLLDF